MCKKLIYLISFILVLAVTGTALADQWDITVPDAGFDDHVLNNVGDWIYIGDGSYTGAWKSLFAENGAWIDYNYYANDGDLPALSGNNKAYGTYTADDYIYQILEETFIEGGTYTLSVWVGIAWSGYDDFWSLYFTGEDHNNNLIEASGNAPVGSWQQVSLVYTATAADAGKNVGIKMKGAEYVTFEDVTLSYDAGAEPGVTITVEEGGDIAAANELAKAGDTIEIAAGTYVLTSQILIKDGVTYRGAGPGLTIIDGNDVTRAFAAWGDRGATNGQVDANGIGVPNRTGPTAWVLDGLTIQNCVSDAENRQDILSAARDLLNNYTGTPYTLVTAQEENGGVTDNPEWFDILSGIADDDLTDTELQAYLDANPIGSEGHLIVNDDKSDDGGAIRISNGASGTIQNCEFIACHADDDGGAIMADADYSSNVWTDCTFIGNYTGDDGAAVRYSPDRAELTMTNCAFTGNGKDADGTVVGDDGVWQCKDDDAGPITFENCLFADNACNDDRLIELKAVFSLINCTFIGNVAGDKALIAVRGRAWDSTGDGVADITTDDSIISNCLFINNTMLSDGNVIGDTRDDVFAPIVTNCLFFGNLDGTDPASNTDNNSPEVGTIDVSAVTDAAQLVVDPAGDYHLAVGSAAIDASDPDTATAADIEGTAAVGVRDVGTYEFVAP